MNFCNCRYCTNGHPINNPYPVYHKTFLIDELHLVFDYRVAAMCKYGCKKYRKKPTCPPNIPDIEYFKKALNEYENILILGRRYPYSDGYFSTHWRTYSTNEIHHMLLEKESELREKGFLYAKAFIGGSCKLCPDDMCVGAICKLPSKGRIPLEATGINVFKLMSELGLLFEEPPINFFWRLGAVFY